MTLFCSLVCFCYDEGGYKGCDFEKREQQDEDITRRFEELHISSMSLHKLAKTLIQNFKVHTDKLSSLSR